MFFGQEVHYYMVHIAYYTDLNFQICTYSQKRRICRENSQEAPDENFCGHFCPSRKAANFCHPEGPIIRWVDDTYDLIYSEHDRQRQQAGYCCGPSYSCGGELLAHI